MAIKTMEMKGKTGSGAATSSGINYQNRVAAYLLATALCENPLAEFGDSKLRTIGFETTQAVDDLNVELESEKTAYLQVKRNLSFSTKANSELYSVLKQFAKQSAGFPARPSQLFLVTTTDSSRRITGEMKAALDAFRIGPEEAFRRDQPVAIRELIDDLLNAISAVKQANEETGRASAAAILRNTYVWILDLQGGSCLEQATLLILQSRRFINPRLLWGKLVADCVNHSSLRHTISISEARSQYEKFLLPIDPVKPEMEGQFLKIGLEQYEFSVGRELVLGTLAETPADQLLLFEFYRFDDDCQERIRFDNGKCLLGNGLVIESLHRTATYAGMERFIKDNPDLVGERRLIIAPINSDQDFEKGICADRQRAILRHAFLGNSDLLKCLHCGKAVSTSAADIVESGSGPNIRVGLMHRPCTRVDDRVLGVPKGDFFERFNYLVNFDVNLWFQAAQRGQGAFAHRELYETFGVIAWSGRRSVVSPGDYLVECKLVNGQSVFLFERGQIHRFTKAEAEEAAGTINASIGSAKETNDPHCFSDQTRAFGTRSTLSKMLGVSEKFVEIKRASVAHFQQEIANQYAIWVNWYAPLAYLRLIEDGSVFTIGGFQPVMTNPFTLDRYLENWKMGRVDIPPYEVMILENDRQFDDFAADAEDNGIGLIVDPLVDPAGKPNFVSGIPIQSMQQLLRRTRPASGPTSG